MKRFVLQQLIEWKHREDRKTLLFNGARQVGKTWLLHEDVYKRQELYHALALQFYNPYAEQCRQTHTHYILVHSANEYFIRK